jgi:hypothetical protein
MRKKSVEFSALEPISSASRPRGAHLFRVYSLKNRRSFKFFYRTQLVEWARLEFEPGLLSFVPENSVFKTDGGKLFIAFKLSYANSETLVYIADPRADAVSDALIKYCTVMGLGSRGIGQEVISEAKFEIWNRLKILSLIGRWREDLTAENLKKFLLCLKGCASCSLGSFEQMDGFNNGRGLAFALEMVRVGRFQLPSLHERSLAMTTPIICSSAGGEG